MEQTNEWFPIERKPPIGYPCDVIMRTEDGRYLELVGVFDVLGWKIREPIPAHRDQKILFYKPFPKRKGII